MNYIISHACEIRSNTDNTLVIRAMGMWQLKGTIPFLEEHIIASQLLKLCTHV